MDTKLPQGKIEVARAIYTKVETMDRLLEVIKFFPTKETEAFVKALLSQEGQQLEALCSSLTRSVREELGEPPDVVPTATAPAVAAVSTLTVPSVSAAPLPPPSPSPPPVIVPALTPREGGAIKTHASGGQESAAGATGTAGAAGTAGAIGAAVGAAGAAATASTITATPFTPTGFPSYQLAMALKAYRRKS